MNVTEKPWGKEEVLDVNDRYMVKRLTMRRGERCSLQYHKKKRETIYVLAGRLRVMAGSSATDLQGRIYRPGEYLTLEPGAVHRMEAVEDSVYLEASTPELEDVVRLSDDYERIR